MNTRFSMVLLSVLLLAGCSVLPTSVSQNPAVKSLVDQAGMHTSSGDYEQASASLERALRIEPRNAVLWQQLALVRIEQELFVQAENLAAKSNALVGDNRRLRKKNWLIIADARSRRGDIQGAQAAQDRAARQ